MVYPLLWVILQETTGTLISKIGPNSSTAQGERALRQAGDVEAGQARGRSQGQAEVQVAHCSRVDWYSALSNPQFPASSPYYETFV